MKLKRTGMEKHMNKIYENIISRTSVRAFTDEVIKKEDLDMILSAGIHAPSAMNKQSWQFTVLTDRSKIQSLAKVVREELGRDERYNFYNPTALVIMSNDRDNNNGEADCACALQNMFLMANDLGIGSCWINQLKGICDSPKVREKLTELSIPENHLVWGMASLGYPATEIQKKEKNEAVIKFV